MSSIDHYLDIKENFSDFNSLDLQQLLVDIENYYITYRDYLGIPSNITFGAEIEYENISKVNFSDYDLPGWVSDTDASLHLGGEMRSPILTDNEKTWKQFATICQVLREKKAETVSKAGGHIHFGTSVFEKKCDNLKNFIKLIILYENLLYRFAYGDKISARKSLDEYALPIAEKMYELQKEIKKCSKFDRLMDIISSNKKYVSVSFRRANFLENGENSTIEFRFPNSSTEEIIWQNHTNVFAKMLMYAVSDDFDYEFIRYKLSKLDEDYFDRIRYNEICLRQALEFADLIFSDNLDKINFLRQYIKSFENNYGIKEAVLSKDFFRR